MPLGEKCCPLPTPSFCQGFQQYGSAPNADNQLNIYLSRIITRWGGGREERKEWRQQIKRHGCTLYKGLRVK